MLRFFAELLPCLLVGIALGRVAPGLPARLSAPLIRWGVPMSLAALLLREGLRGDLVISGLMALLVTGTALAALRGLPPLRRTLPGAALSLGAVTGNTAYWGLPVALALLPPHAVGHAVSYDLVATLLTWSLGPLIVEGTPISGAALINVLRTSPAVRGLLLALLVQSTPWRQTVTTALWWPARLVILVALSVVGMRLGAMLRSGRPLTHGTGVAAALLTKLLLLPGLMLLLTIALALEPSARDGVVLQAAAPTAISILLLAEASGQEVEDIAALVFAGTALALVSVPLWWLVLSRLPPA